MPGDRQAYQQALQRAAGYVAAKAWTRAIAEYQKALTQFPDDEETWSKVADALERIGRLDGPVRAARLDPNNSDIQRRLARVYRHQGKTKLAIRAHLALARIHHKHGKFQEAVEQVQAAATLDPDDPDILTAMELLRGGQPAPPAPPPARKVDTSIFDLPIEEDAEESRGSPVEIAREKALSELAGSIFEEALPAQQLSKAEIDAL